MEGGSGRSLLSRLIEMQEPRGCSCATVQYFARRQCQRPQSTCADAGTEMGKARAAGVSPDDTRPRCPNLACRGQTTRCSVCPATTVPLYAERILARLHLPRSRGRRANDACDGTNYMRSGISSVPSALATIPGACPHQTTANCCNPTAGQTREDTRFAAARMRGA